MTQLEKYLTMRKTIKSRNKLFYQQAMAMNLYRTQRLVL